MHQFIDGKNRRWGIEINVTQIRRVRDLLAVDLFALIDDGMRPLAELLGDPMKLVDVVYALVKDQAEKDSVSDEDFGRGMAGDAIQQAAEAFTQELFDFFPETKDRLILRKAHDKGRQIAEALADKRSEILDTLIPEQEAARIVRLRVPSGSSGAAPESSASTPEPGPCET
jgi:hypothetical protein